MIPIVTNDDAVRTLERIADLLDIKGENSFKARAYRQAAVQIDTVHRPLQSLLEEPGGLRQLDGVGAAIADKLSELITTGRLGYLEKLELEVPPTLLGIRDLPGVGPRTAALLWHEADITTLEQLSAAAHSGVLEGLPRMGTRTIERVQRAVTAQLEQGSTPRRSREQVDPLATGLRDLLRSFAEVTRAEIAGSYRRGSETVGDLDIVAATAAAPAVLRQIAASAGVERVLLQGDTKCSFQVDGGFQVDCRAIPEESFGAAWLYFTGSKQHNIRLRARAQRQRLLLNEYGLHRHDGVRIAGATEQEIYAALGLNWIDPIQRTDAYDLHKAAVTVHPTTTRADDEV